jgi:hypothetical protein
VTMNQTRFGLLGIFTGCLLAQLIAFLSVASKMWPEDLQALILKIVAVYSVHLTVILGGIFAQPKGSLEAPPASLAWTAVALAVLWNVATQDSAAELIKYIDGVGSSTSFLVTGALAFFFTKGTGNIKSQASGSRANSRDTSGAE